MKFPILLLAASSMVATVSAQVPKIFQGLLEQNVQVRAQIGRIMLPKEMEKFEVKIRAAAQKDPKAFREFAGKHKPGIPLPFDEILGLTKEEHAEYVALWKKREFTPVANTNLTLRKGAGDYWIISASDKGSAITTLRYSEKEDVFRSPDGDLKRIDDFSADETSPFGAWSGNEWKFTQETEFDKTMQNFAIGRMGDGKNGLLVYVNQSISTASSKLLVDTKLVVRFPLSKPGAPKPAAAKPAEKPAEKPAKPAAKPKNPK